MIVVILMGRGQLTWKPLLDLQEDVLTMHGADTGVQYQYTMLAQLSCKHQHGLYTAGIYSFLSSTRQMHLLLSPCRHLIRLLLVPVQAHNDTLNTLYHLIHITTSFIVVLQ